MVVVFINYSSIGDRYSKHNQTLTWQKLGRKLVRLIFFFFPRWTGSYDY